MLLWLPPGFPAGELRAHPSQRILKCWQNEVLCSTPLLFFKGQSVMAVAIEIRWKLLSVIRYYNSMALVVYPHKSLDGGYVIAIQTEWSYISLCQGWLRKFCHFKKTALVPLLKKHPI